MEFEDEFDEDENVVDDVEDDDDVSSSSSSEDIVMADINDVALSFLLQKINRILAENENIVVTKDTTGGVDIGATDLKTNQIFLNYFRLRTYTKTIDNFLILTRGINYHELAHIIFTDASHSKIEAFYNKLYQDNHYSLPIAFYHLFDAVNLLEDCRAENLFSSLYDRAKYYFSYAVVQILLSSKRKNPQDYNFGNYLLMYGRKFLNIDLSSYKKSISNVSDADIKSGENLVDSYIIEKDMEKRLAIAYSLALLLHKNNQNASSTSSSNSLNTAGRKGGKKQRIDQTVEVLKQILKTGQWKIETEDDDDDDNSEEKSDKKSDKKGNKSKSQSDKDAKDEKDVEKVEKNKLEKLERQVQKLLDKVADKIEKDVEDLKSAIKGDEFAQLDGIKFLPTEVERLESKKVTQVLRILRGDLIASVRKFQKSGQLDIQSAMRAQKEDSMNIFRKNRLNKIDKSKLGVAILLDGSSSVDNSEFNKEITAAWCLSNAVESVGNKVEVIEFSNSCKVIKGFNSAGDWKRHYNGGTIVAKPLKLAMTDLLKLQKKENINNLIAIVVSDGAFNDKSEAIEEFRKLKKAGIKTVWILANNYIPYNSDEVIHSVDVFIHLKTLRLLSKEIQKLVTHIQKNINIKLQSSGGFY